MKIKKLFTSILVTLIGLSLAGLAFSMAWLASANTDVDIHTTTGGVITQYFDSGSGTEQDPFVITRPIHLYHLTELYEELDGFAEENYHFQLGRDLRGQGPEVYKYDNDGKLVEGQYDTSLNMNDPDYANLRPIGSEENPFGGTFDGSNLTIDNLHISGSGVSDIGVFGYVTDEAVIQDLYLDNLEIDITGAVSDNHDLHDENAYVGFIAGHIDDATCFSNTYVNNCEITGQSCDIKNDWGYFGYCDNAGTLQSFIDKAKSGDEEAWGGSFNSKTYTNLLYNLNHSTTSETTNTFSGDGGYTVKKTASAKTDPNNNQVVYRLRDGSFIPLKFHDDTHTQAALGNTGYLVGSNIGTGANASPKISSYKMVNLQNALTNTPSTNMQTAYNAANIAYTDSKLEIMTYKNGWKRIKDDHNSGNNSTNTAITSYTKTDLDNFGFQKYVDSRNSLQEVLESSAFLHGIHFDNNQVSTSNLLTVPANTARINGSRVNTTYQLPKGSIDFNLKEEGFINFFAGTYNSSDVTLNFFSLYKVNRSGGNITSLDPINKIYKASSGTGYVYQTGNSTPSGAGDLMFDVQTALHGSAPVKNMMYYFEIPVNAGEYAMGVAGSTQGAYMIYLDLGANGSTEENTVDDFASVEYRSTPDTTDHSILLITYELSDEESLILTVAYSNNVYTITAHSNNNVPVDITTLSESYTYYCNGSNLQSIINTHTILT